MNVSASRTVRTIRSRLLRANGPRRARSSTSHAGVVHPALRIALCTRPFHCGYVDRSSTSSNESLRCARRFERGGEIHRRKYRRLSRSGVSGRRPLAAERARQQWAARFEQAVEIVGLIERRLPGQHLALGRRSSAGRLRHVDHRRRQRIGVELQLFGVAVGGDSDDAAMPGAVWSFVRAP